MKAILEFNLPDDKHEHWQSINADRYFCIIWNAREDIRQKLKHADINCETIKILEEIQESLIVECEEWE